jgi:hypothetical protein
MKMGDKPVERAYEAIEHAEASAEETLEATVEAREQLDAITNDSDEAAAGVDIAGGGGSTTGGTTND